MNEWLNGRMNERMHEWMHEMKRNGTKWNQMKWTLKRNDWHEWRKEWVNEWVKQWMHEWITEAVNAWMNEWTERNETNERNEMNETNGMNETNQMHETNCWKERSDWMILNEWVHDCMNAWRKRGREEGMNERWISSWYFLCELDGSLLPEQVEELCLGLTADDQMIRKDYIVPHRFSSCFFAASSGVWNMIWQCERHSSVRLSGLCNKCWDNIGVIFHSRSSSGVALFFQCCLVWALF